MDRRRNIPYPILFNFLSRKLSVFLTIERQLKQYRKRSRFQDKAKYLKSGHYFPTNHASYSLGKFIVSHSIGGMHGRRWHRMPQNVSSSKRTSPCPWNRESWDINFVVDVSYRGTLVSPRPQLFPMDVPCIVCDVHISCPRARVYMQRLFPISSEQSTATMCRLTVYHSNGFPPCTPQCFVGETWGHGTRVTLLLNLCWC